MQPFWVPSTLWRVHTPDCFATIDLPDLTQHTDQHLWHLRDREQRRRAYEILIQHCRPQAMIRFLDGALLVDLWDDLDLPDPVRNLWALAYGDATETKRVDVALAPYDTKYGAAPDEAHLARISGYRMLPRKPQPKEKYVTVPDAADILGIPTSLLNRLIVDGTFPALSPTAGTYLLRLRDVQEFGHQWHREAPPASD